MKPPISYYGGKQRMCTHLLPMIPEDHTLYTEPFLGGGALFWRKDPSPAEVINDQDDDIVNFYRVLQTDFAALEQMIQGTLHSRSTHQAARYVLKKETEHIKKPYTYFLGDIKNANSTAPANVQRAWAFWVQTNMSYSAKLFGGFAYCRGVSTTRAIHNKRDRFQAHYRDRLKHVCIECNDALQVITSRDSKKAFHYCDPPYFNSDMGHYDGYTREDFKELLETLSTVQGRFLLSSYPSEILAEYTTQQAWKQKDLNKPLTAGKKNNGRKTEVLTYNY